MNRVRPLELAALLTCFLIIAFPQSAGSELKPDTISPAHRSASQPVTDSDGSGDVVAVWRDLDDETESIRAAFRTRGEAFGPSKQISLPSVAAESPNVSMDQLGNAVAVWNVSSNGRDSIVQAAVRPAGGDWTDPQELSDPTEPAFAPDVAIEAGRITAVWVARHQGQPVIQSASRAMTTTWSSATTISGAVGGGYVPSVAMDDQGGAVAAWNWGDGLFLLVHAAVRTSDGSWSEPEQLSAPGHSASSAVVAMDGAGNAVVGWIRSNGLIPAAQISTRPANGSWAPARNLSRRPGSATSIDLAMNRRGDAIVSWIQGYGGLSTALRSVGSNEWTRSTVARAWYGLRASIAMDERGNATAVWNVNYAISASYKPEGKAWQEDYLLAGYEDQGSFSYPSVTAQSPDNAMAVWVRSDTNDDQIQTVGYDVDTSAREHEDEDDDCGDDCDDDDGGGDDDGGDDDGGDDDSGETVQGTPHADVLVGTSGDDVFYARGGNDLIVGRGGRDLVYGGPGNDRIVGGRGSDRLLGGAGRDRILGGHGNDRLRGGSGRDVLSGGSGDDVLRASDRARDLAFGGSGLDRYRLDGLLDRARSIESRL
jgi:Ca2+-binding RTX toxin-like protein